MYVHEIHTRGGSVDVHEIHTRVGSVYVYEIHTRIIPHVDAQSAALRSKPFKKKSVSDVQILFI